MQSSAVGCPDLLAQSTGGRKGSLNRRNGVSKPGKTSKSTCPDDAVAIITSQPPWPSSPMPAPARRRAEGLVWSRTISAESIVKRRPRWTLPRQGGWEIRKSAGGRLHLTQQSKFRIAVRNSCCTTHRFSLIPSMYEMLRPNRARFSPPEADIRIRSRPNPTPAHGSVIPQALSSS